MITFIYGADSYRVKQRVDEIISSVGKDADVLRFDIDNPEEIDNLKSAIKTVALFSNKEVFVIKNAFLKSDIVHQLLKDYKLDNDSNRHVLIYASETEAKLKKLGKQFFEFLTKKSAKTEIINTLNNIQLSNWITQEAKKYGISIGREATQKLIEFTNDAPVMFGNKAGIVSSDRTWRLGGEIKKLANYKAGKNENEVTIKDIETLIIPRDDVGIFAVIDSIASRNKSRAVLLLNKALQNDMDPYYLHTMILYQFRNLLTIKSLIKSTATIPMITSKTKLHPFVVRKTYTQAKEFDLEELKRYFIKLHDLEIETKSGKADLIDGLYQFVFAL